MDATTKKIARLLQPEHASETRCAAAVVLGEIGSKDAELATTLCERLDDSDPKLRAEVIRTIGKLRIDQALSQLLTKIQDGGEDSELAAAAAAHLGAKGTHALQKLMDKVAPGLRRRIARALGAGGSSSAENAAVEALLDKDPGVVEAATRSLIGTLPRLKPNHKQALADQLLGYMKDKKTVLSPTAEAAVVRLLAGLGDNRAEAVLWERTAPSYAADMRAAALQTLGKWVTKPNKEQIKRLVACATDNDFRVAAPALMMLKTAPVSGRVSAEWMSLFEAPDVAVRQFAIEKLGDRDTAEVTEALLGQLDHPDKNIRDKSLKALVQSKRGRDGLAQALLDSDTTDKAWLLARGQAALVKDYPAELRNRMFKAACDWLEAGDRRCDPVLFLLRESDASDLVERMHKRAESLRKKKSYDKAVTYLRHLTRDPACAVPIRLELATCLLKVSKQDMSRDARSSDPSLQQFGKLVSSYEQEVVDHLEKAKWLEAEDLFYLGFHFTEKDGVAHKFGGDVLELLIKRSPRTKLAQDAKRKLQSEGLR